MATWFSYRCNKCGYEVNTSPDGSYMLMSGEYQNYSCADCKEIISLDPESELSQVCPECGSKTIEKWNPKTGKCPKCGGTMKKVPGTMMLAD